MLLRRLINLAFMHIGQGIASSHKRKVAQHWLPVCCTTDMLMGDAAAGAAVADALLYSELM